MSLTKTTTPHVKQRRRLPMSWGWMLSYMAALALLALLGWGLVNASQGPVETGEAPNFELTTFEGKVIRLSDLRGQVVVINFWASWCPPCREEAPYLETTWRKYKNKGVMFIGVDYLDTEKKALEYIAEFNITYPNGPDIETRIADAYRIKGVPETFFVDKQGSLQGVKIGPLRPPELEERIEAMLTQ